MKGLTFSIIDIWINLQFSFGFDFQMPCAEAQGSLLLIRIIMVQNTNRRQDFSSSLRYLGHRESMSGKRSTYFPDVYYLITVSAEQDMPM